MRAVGTTELSEMDIPTPRVPTATRGSGSLSVSNNAAGFACAYGPLSCSVSPAESRDALTSVWYALAVDDPGRR